MVVSGDEPCLLGMGLASTFAVRQAEHLPPLVCFGGGNTSHPLEVFWEELSTLQGYKATIHMESSAHPKLCKAQAVPYARAAKVGQELDQLVADGILGPV